MQNSSSNMEKFKTVDQFLDSLDSNKRAQVDALRAIILTSADGVSEHIKWNAPSYVLDGEDRITFNLLNKQGIVMLVLHMGATRKETKGGKPLLAEDFGLVQWSSDIRGVISFHDLSDIEKQEEKLAQILQRWLAIKL